MGVCRPNAQDMSLSIEETQGAEVASWRDRRRLNAFRRAVAWMDREESWASSAKDQCRLTGARSDRAPAAFPLSVHRFMRSTPSLHQAGLLLTVFGRPHSAPTYRLPWLLGMGLDDCCRRARRCQVMRLLAVAAPRLS